MVGAAARLGSSNTAGASATWETHRSKAKGLKAQIDTKMLEFGHLAGRLEKATAAAPAPSMTEVAALRDNIEHCLKDLLDSSEALNRLAASGSQTAQAARFRESHQELLRDFKRVTQNIDHQQQHARLLSGSGRRKDTSQDGEEANLLRERSALDVTLSMTDEVLSQAQATHDRLIGQRGMLGSVTSKVGTLTAKFPTLNSLIGDISDRKKKEQLVLSFTVACCMFFTAWYKFL
jgi:Golgi SNAP receptor complex protein 1